MSSGHFSVWSILILGILGLRRRFFFLESVFSASPLFVSFSASDSAFLRSSSDEISSSLLLLLLGLMSGFPCSPFKRLTSSRSCCSSVSKDDLSLAKSSTRLNNFLTISCVAPFSI
ncbi:MAG: GlyGly-CTERM sorting domain-containing protein [Methylococcales bacterium]|nr:GlyGly-CTERM sorting domain-containing protein [Methylococcales bacterium]